jgi:hypothetical protein
MSDEPTPQSSIVLYQIEDGRTRVVCGFENETIWLTQALVPELFEISVSIVKEHLKSLWVAGEVTEGPTVRKLRIVRTEERRDASRG